MAEDLENQENDKIISINIDEQMNLLTSIIRCLLS